MLECEKCGDIYIVANPEHYKKCESCGGKLVNKDKALKKTSLNRNQGLKNYEQ